jgi:hypothetical protein
LPFVRALGRIRSDKRALIPPLGFDDVDRDGSRAASSLDRLRAISFVRKKVFAGRQQK